MLRAAQVVIIGILAKVCLAASLAFFGEGGSLALDAIGGLNVEDFFSKDFGGEGGEGGDAAFEIVAAVHKW